MRSWFFRPLLLALALCWVASHADAATLSGVTLPDSYTVGGQTLVLNGIGLRTLTIFRVRVYVAGLYLPARNHDGQQILASPGTKVILLKFIRAASKERIESQYRAGEEANCGDGSCDPANAADFERLVVAVPAVSPGDTTTFIFNPNGFKVLANDRMIADIANRDLAQHFLAGFIGARPPSQTLRRQLLGLPDE